MLKRGFVVWLVMLLPMAAAAQLPPIREIAYEGNRVTQALTMQRELTIAVGEQADPGHIERSRQAIQDLGLFREVTVRQEDMEGGVRVVFSVKEKWYVLPIPRLEINSDGDTGYGMQLRWNNLWGLNHRLEMLAVQRDYKRKDRDDSSNFYGNYDIPFLGDTRNALNISGSHVLQDSTSDKGINYRERADRFGFVVSRALTPGPLSQGWKVGGGLFWQEQEARGENAPPSYGTAVSPVASISFRNLRDHIYSETGQMFSSSIGFAAEGALSDYGYFSHYTRYSHERQLGETAHQTLRLVGEIGGFHAGPRGREPDAFEYGGSVKLRGYDREIIDGDFAYYGSIDYYRPMGCNWLRGMVNLEAGSALDDLNDSNSRVLYASIGTGISVRVTWLVNVQFEAGIAYPLVEGDGLRFFARAL
jgi:outer membrane protein assembly factor BamA